MPDFWLLLTAIGFLLLPYRGYVPSHRVSALKTVRKSDWRRPFLEHLRLWNLAGSIAMWVGMWCALYFWSAGPQILTLLSCILLTIGFATAITVSVMPIYIVMDASKKRAERRARNSPKP